MSDSFAGERVRTEPGSLIAAVAVIVVTGLALGIAYNWAGRGARPSWGLDWIARDRVADLPVVGAAPPPAPAPVTAPAASASHTDLDDPMAIPEGAAPGQGLPDIPDLDRPVQIALAPLKQLFDASAVLVVDARPRDEYAESHIVGAVNLPFDEAVSDPTLIERFRPQAKPIVVYCGGGACELSLKLADDLMLVGHRRVAVFMGGFPEWVDAGYPVAKGSGG